MKTSTRYIILFTMLGLASAAYAVKERVDKYGGQFPVWFNKGIYVGPNSPDPSQSTLNKVTRVTGCQGAYTFPLLGTRFGDRTCAETNAITCANVRVGDVCQVGLLSTLAADGGSRLLIEGDLTCYVSATDAVKGKLCMIASDGGIYQAPDAGLNFIVTSNQ